MTKPVAVRLSSEVGLDRLLDELQTAGIHPASPHGRGILLGGEFDSPAGDRFHLSATARAEVRTRWDELSDADAVASGVAGNPSAQPLDNGDLVCAAMGLTMPSSATPAPPQPRSQALPASPRGFAAPLSGKSNVDLVAEAMGLGRPSNPQEK